MAADAILDARAQGSGFLHTRILNPLSLAPLFARSGNDGGSAETTAGLRLESYEKIKDR